MKPATQSERTLALLAGCAPLNTHQIARALQTTVEQVNVVLHGLLTNGRLSRRELKRREAANIYGPYGYAYTLAPPVPLIRLHAQKSPAETERHQKAAR